MTGRTLLVVVPDSITVILDKGEYPPRYYNPGDLFDEVHILLTNNDRPDAERLQMTVGSARLHLHNLPLPSFVRTLGWQPLLLQEWVRRGVALARQIQPDLIRAHGLHVHTYLVARLRMALGVPAVVSLHSNLEDHAQRCHTLPHKFAFRRWRDVAEKHLHAIDHFIIVYAPIRRDLEPRGVRNYSLIYNVVGLGAIPKDDYALKDGVLRCVCVGRQDSEVKDPRNIVRAVAGLDGVELHLYGNGNLHDELVALADGLGIAGRVTFKRSVPNPELMALLHTFDAYVFNSLSYGISKTVMEAALVGLPIVHNWRQPPLSEELDADYYLKVEDTVAGYQQGLQALRDDPDLRRRLGAAARAYALQKWSPEATEAQTVHLYKRLLAGETMQPATRT